MVFDPSSAANVLNNWLEIGLGDDIWLLIFYSSVDKDNDRTMLENFFKQMTNLRLNSRKYGVMISYDGMITFFDVYRKAMGTDVIIKEVIIFPFVLSQRMLYNK